MDKLRNIIKDYWLLCLICIQPFLDVFAFWTRNEKGTAAGYLRLIIMGVLCLYVLIHIRSYRRFIPSVAAVVLVFGLHVLNCFRKGYICFTSDTRMIASVAYLPVIAISLCCLVDENELIKQIKTGVIINFSVECLIVLVSYITRTYTHTYLEGLGIAGWVTTDNRCCHSDIISSASVIAAYFAVSSKKKLINISIPVILFVLLITNGTTVSYFTILAVCACYPVFLLVRSIVEKKRLDYSQRLVSIVMAAIFAVSIAIYPITPRYKMEELKRLVFDDRETRFAAEMDELGYNVYNVTLEEIFSDELLHERFIEYYKRYVFGGVDPLGKNYSFDRIIRAYNGTVDSHTLGDVREMKNVYVGFIFEDSDLLTRMFGIEYDQIGPDKVNDLENDWYAILFYLGYFGFALTLAAVVFLLIRIFRYVFKHFRSSLTDLNFTILFGFAMQLGMAYFSGAIMRRPSASVYVALFIAMIFYSTSDRKVLKA